MEERKDPRTNRQDHQVIIEVMIFNQLEKSDYAKVRVPKGTTLKGLLELLDRAATDKDLRQRLLTMGNGVIDLAKRSWSQQLLVAHWLDSLKSHFIWIDIDGQVEALSRLNAKTRSVSRAQKGKPIRSHAFNRSCTIAFFSHYYCEIQEFK